MKVDFNSQTPKSNPQFGRIDFISGGEQTLRKVLKPAEWKEFATIIEAQKENPVGINIYSQSGKKIGANIFDDTTCRQYGQRFFESTMGAIKRFCRIADEMLSNMKERQSVNVNEIINNARK